MNALTDSLYLTKDLNSFDAEVRARALDQFAAAILPRDMTSYDPAAAVANMHCHFGVLHFLWWKVPCLINPHCACALEAVTFRHCVDPILEVVHPFIHALV